jgi:hypothetical protein
MLFRKSKYQTRLRAIESVIRCAGGGVFKRIDENRELLELIQRESPEFLRKNSWVISWLKSHDDFFTELAKATQMQVSDEREPRHWPLATEPQRKRERGRSASDEKSPEAALSFPH